MHLAATTLPRASSRSKSCGLAVAIVVLLLTARATAEPAPSTIPPAPHLIFPAPRQVCKPSTIDELPVCRWVGPGHYLDADQWSKLDVELRRLQEREVRLDAENKSFRESAKAWQPGWRTLAIAFASGIALGAATFHLAK